MKVHFGAPALPWHMKAKLPSIYANGFEYASYQHGQISRVFGISFGYRRFFGFIVAGPFVHEDVRIQTATSPRKDEI